jgi:hypothetical protein
MKNMISCTDIIHFARCVGKVPGSSLVDKVNVITRG